MKISILLSRQILLVYLIILTPIEASIAQAIDDREITHISYPNWFNESPFLDLSEDIGKSRLNGKKALMILFTSEGCSYCDAFIRLSLGNSKIATAVQKHFYSIGMEIFDDTEMKTPLGISMPVKKFAKSEGVGFSPTLLFYGNNGKRILRLVGYQSPKRFNKIINYVIDEHYRTKSFRDFIKHQEIKVSPERLNIALIQDQLFSKPPYALDRRYFPATKPLMIIFEKKGCEECTNFHSSVLELKEIRGLLEKFEIVRLDADDVKTPVLAPNGKKITPANWYKKASLTRVPAILFYDEKGNEVLKTDSLVLRKRMRMSLSYILEKAYKKNWTYQRFARTKGIERAQRQQK